MVVGKLIKKSKEERNLFETRFQLFSTLFILPPFVIEIIRILKLIRSPHNAKFEPYLSGF